LDGSNRRYLPKPTQFFQKHASSSSSWWRRWMFMKVHAQFPDFTRIQKQIHHHAAFSMVSIDQLTSKHKSSRTKRIEQNHFWMQNFKHT
jgi:hypothetical protein